METERLIDKLEDAVNEISSLFDICDRWILEAR